MRPWRTVLDAQLREGRGSVLGGATSRRTRWYVLTLTCGHKVERTVRYRPAARPAVGGTQHRSVSDVLSPPQQVRCDFCPEGGPPMTDERVPPSERLDVDDTTRELLGHESGGSMPPYMPTGDEIPALLSPGGVLSTVMPEAMYRQVRDAITPPDVAAIRAHWEENRKRRADAWRSMDDLGVLLDLCSTCTCAPYPHGDGPEPDCPIHGAIRALNEAHAELEAVEQESTRRGTRVIELERRLVDAEARIAAALLALKGWGSYGDPEGVLTAVRRALSVEATEGGTANGR